MGELTLVLGGARSGKSAFAESLLAGLDRAIYLATARAGDREVEERIALHRARRPAGWATVEVEGRLADALAAQLGDSPRGSAGNGSLPEGPGEASQTARCDSLLLDSLDMYLSSQELLEDPERALSEVDDFLSLVGELGVPTVVVSCEAGMGVVPPFPAGRALRDLLGLANQRVAALADSVFLVVAGLSLSFKGAGAPQGVPSILGPYGGPRAGGGSG